MMIRGADGVFAVPGWLAVSVTGDTDEAGGCLQLYVLGRLMCRNLAVVPCCP